MRYLAHGTFTLLSLCPSLAFLFFTIIIKLFFFTSVSDSICQRGKILYCSGSSAVWHLEGNQPSTNKEKGIKAEQSSQTVVIILSDNDNGRVYLI